VQPIPTVEPTEADLLAAARAGDEHAFHALIAPHLRALHVHGYRMLGSYDDAEEAVQDVLLRAWKGLRTFEGRAPLRHWLYRITTTTCLKAIQARARQPVVDAEIPYLQPYPDHLLDQLTDHDADPATEVTSRDTVTLAFITALQRLPATQRAVLILRDVLAFTAPEVADLLDTTVAAVNSALQRARATLATSHTTGPRPLSATEQSIVERFIRAWRDCDIAALSALLRDDVTLHMPPDALVFSGRDAVTEFFATVPAGGRLDLIRLVPIRANGQPALAAYLPDGTGTCRGYGIMVLTLTGERVATITGFPSAHIFAAFGLPAVDPAAARS
jgi:RNA polymerase sigma-70 factor (ECF subfamily)